MNILKLSPQIATDLHNDLGQLMEMRRRLIDMQQRAVAGGHADLAELLSMCILHIDLEVGLVDEELLDEFIG